MFAKCKGADDLKKMQGPVYSWHFKDYHGTLILILISCVHQRQINFFLTIIYRITIAFFISVFSHVWLLL